MRLAMILAMGLTLGACGGSGGSVATIESEVTKDNCVTSKVTSQGNAEVFDLSCPGRGVITCYTYTGYDKAAASCDWSNWVTPTDNGGIP